MQPWLSVLAPANCVAAIVRGEGTFAKYGRREEKVFETRGVDHGFLWLLVRVRRAPRHFSFLYVLMRQLVSGVALP